MKNQIMDNGLKKIIDSLRLCSDQHNCWDCAYRYDQFECMEVLIKDAADLIERLFKENEELKDLAERRLKRKNMYKERSERHLKEAFELRIRVAALENELLSEHEEDYDDICSQKECHEED